MRIILIDPVAKTVTEDTMPDVMGMREKMGLKPSEGVEAAVQNGATGDALYVNKKFSATKPRWYFLGDLYAGYGIIMGKYGADAVVPLERVQGQVKFSDMPTLKS